jgi:hypothetical protein
MAGTPPPLEGRKMGRRKFKTRNTAVTRGWPGGWHNEEKRAAASRIQPSPPRHDFLPPDLLERIHAIHEGVRDLDGSPLAEFEMSFAQDKHPEREVEIWESIVNALGRVGAAMPDVTRKKVFRVLLAHSMGMLTADQWTDPLVREILRIADERK